MRQGKVAVAMGGFRGRDGFVDVDVVVTGGGAHELQDFGQGLARFAAREHLVRGDNGTGVDEGVARASLFGLKLHNGIECTPRWLAAHALPQLVA